jgi:type I restriction enzyme S subunit
LCITIAANIADTALLGYPACFPDSVVGFLVNPALCLPWFVKWCIDVVRTDLESFAPATAQKNINLAVLDKIQHSIPPIDEQTEIVRRVTELYALADGIKRRYDTAVAAVENITPSLLAKAFRGDLAPQNSTDEPARVLLERIRAGREEGARERRSSGNGAERAISKELAAHQQGVLPATKLKRQAPARSARCAASRPQSRR